MKTKTTRIIITLIICLISTLQSTAVNSIATGHDGNVSSESSATASDADAAITYLQGMEDYFNSEEVLQEVKNTIIISEYNAKRKGNVLTVTYKYDSLVNFNLMTEQEKQQMADQSINLMKSVLAPEELAYHENKLVPIKFIWIDKARRFYTAEF